MAVRDDRSDVKQTTTGFRGPLMVQSLTSAKSKFLSLPDLVIENWEGSVIEYLFSDEIARLFSDKQWLVRGLSETRWACRHVPRDLSNDPEVVALLRARIIKALKVTINN